MRVRDTVNSYHWGEEERENGFGSFYMGLDFELWGGTLNGFAFVGEGHKCPLMVGV